jgi:hypothetical protein
MRLHPLREDDLVNDRCSVRIDFEDAGDDLVKPGDIAHLTGCDDDSQAENEGIAD